MSKAEFRLMIDSEIKDRFKAACKSLNPQPAMTSEISGFMELYADYVEKTGKRPHITSISHEHECDTDITSISQECDMSNYVSKKDYLDLTKRVEALENKSGVSSPIENVAQPVEEMSGNDRLPITEKTPNTSIENNNNQTTQSSLENGHNLEIDISNSTPKEKIVSIPYPEKIELGTKILPNQLTRRLSKFQTSRGQKPVGSGSLVNNRKTKKALEDPNYHQQWIRDRDPDRVLWKYEEEENLYVAIGFSKE